MSCGQSDPADEPGSGRVRSRWGRLRQRATDDVTGCVDIVALDGHAMADALELALRALDEHEEEDLLGRIADLMDGYMHSVDRETTTPSGASGDFPSAPSPANVAHTKEDK